MSTINPTDLIKQLNWRYATKDFDSSKKIPADTWKTLEQALVLAPSSFGLQPWRFFVIADTAMRKKLRAVSWDQAQIEEASHMVVFAHRVGLDVADIDSHLDRVTDVRGDSKESLAQYRQMMVDFVNQPGDKFDSNDWTARQTYIALGFFLASAAVLGIDTCPMEGIDTAKYDEILGLTKVGYRTLAVATAGYRSKDDAYAKAAKVRFAPEQVVQRL